MTPQGIPLLDLDLVRLTSSEMAPIDAVSIRSLAPLSRESIILTIRSIVRYFLQSKKQLYNFIAAKWRAAAPIESGK